MKSGIKRLSDAARDGNLSTVRELLKKGANVNAENTNGDTALILAAINGYLEICQLLLEHEANVNIANTSEDTALLYASREGCVETCQLLLKKGANTNSQNVNYWTTQKTIIIALLSLYTKDNISVDNTALHKATQAIFHSWSCRRRKCSSSKRLL